MTENQQNKLTKKQKEEQAMTQAFLEEIDAVQKKHGLRLAPVLDFSQYAVQPRFVVQRLNPTPTPNAETATE